MRSNRKVLRLCQVESISKPGFDQIGAHIDLRCSVKPTVRILEHRLDTARLLRCKPEYSAWHTGVDSDRPSGDEHVAGLIKHHAAQGPYTIRNRATS